MRLDITNHAIKRWYERFYGSAPNIVEAFLAARKLKRKELNSLITGNRHDRVFYATQYCLFVCKVDSGTIRILSVVPKVRR